MRLGTVILLLPALLTPARAADPVNIDGVRFFETQVRPILEKHCLDCHGSVKQRGGLRLDARDAILKGGDSGPAVDLQKRDASLLLQAVGYQHEPLRMPPKGALSKQQVAILSQWVERGVPHPSTLTETVKPQPRIGEKHWAFQAPLRPELPMVANAAWCRTPPDRFILARLEKERLSPAPEADRAILLRRLTLTLTGLPPTYDELQGFVADPRPDAYEHAVERLLASPAYGERWGRFWLDVARYADSNGLDENIAFGNAWRYRDEVIRAFNEDRPYDRFLVEQIAGDLLPATNDADRRRQLISTGFLALGPKVLAEVDETKMEMDIIDEQIDALGKAVLGLSIGCARCHDHKFDPLPTRDYYALAGIFRSTKSMEHYKKIARWHENPLPGEPAFQGEAATALGMTERATCGVKVHIRGSHLNLGESVPRGLPGVFAKVVAPPTMPDKQSGRLELARWLTEPNHPLTARVFVNRMWRWTFGAGLVRTTDNFGLLGETPSHPELLDWLATEFVRRGWSIKELHRLLVLSATFRQDTHALSRHSEVDPENRLLGRWSVRRLEAEAVRDAILSVSGGLRRKMGGSLLHVKNRAFFFDHTSRDATRYDAPVRAVYLPVVRNHVYDLFQLFDFPDPATPSGDRARTSTAPQELFLLHSPQVLQAADRLAERDTPGLYRAILGRDPSAEEVQLADAIRLRLWGRLSDRDARTIVAQSLLLSNEFLSLP